MCHKFFLAFKHLIHLFLVQNLQGPNLSQLPLSNQVKSPGFIRDLESLLEFIHYVLLHLRYTPVVGFGEHHFIISQEDFLVLLADVFTLNYTLLVALKVVAIELDIGLEGLLGW